MLLLVAASIFLGDSPISSFSSVTLGVVDVVLSFLGRRRVCGVVGGLDSLILLITATIIFDISSDDD
jgi:hypothetical protein